MTTTANNIPSHCEYTQLYTRQSAEMRMRQTQQNQNSSRRRLGIPPPGGVHVSSAGVCFLLLLLTGTAVLQVSFVVVAAFVPMSTATSSSGSSSSNLPHGNRPPIKNAASYFAAGSNNKRRRRIIYEAIVDDNQYYSSNDSSSNDEQGQQRINGANSKNNNNDSSIRSRAGQLEMLKQKEAELAAQLAAVRREKLSALRSRPLTIGIVGFGRFGQFIGKTFAKHGQVVVTSRTDYTAIAETMGAKYVPLNDPQAFLAHDLDVIVVAVSILSFESTVQQLAPHLREYVAASKQPKATNRRRQSSLCAPLMVDVLSVKEHARKVLLEYLPPECDIMCTHPMFGPDSGKNGWYGLNFVYEKTRIDQIVLKADEESASLSSSQMFVDEAGGVHSIHEDSELHVEGMDRMERFLSIWEEEGCRMVPLSCAAHDTYAANSQFVTHMVGRVLGSQGLQETPIDTSGFQSVLKLIGSTTADSFDLFYGLYKYNKNSLETIRQLQTAMNDVVQNLQVMEQAELEKKWRAKDQEQQQKKSTNASSISHSPDTQERPQAAPS